MDSSAFLRGDSHKMATERSPSILRGTRRGSGGSLVRSGRPGLSLLSIYLMDQAALRAVLGERDRSLGIAGTAVRERDLVCDASRRRGAGRRRRGAGWRRGAGRRQRAGRRWRGGGHGTKWRRASKHHAILLVNDHGAPVDVHLPVHLHVTQGHAAPAAVPGACSCACCGAAALSQRGAQRPRLGMARGGPRNPS